MKKSSPTFLTVAAMSLAGFANLGFAERFETVIVKTEDTASMQGQAGVDYLKSNACISTQKLEVRQGEVAYVFSSGATVRPGSTISATGDQKAASVPSIIVDVEGLDSNTTLGGWNPNTASWGSNAAATNISSSTQPIAGPATIRVIIKPFSGRGNSSYNWDTNDADTWDFKASEGYVTFRIVGSEQEVSKKFATVIPENASGNVSIILEQSTDLINWTPVNPGSFPPATSKRFFRVRSEEE